MITEKQMLEQMERHIARAKQVPSSREKHDEIVALRAMCELYITAQNQSAIGGPVGSANPMPSMSGYTGASHTPPTISGHGEPINPTPTKPSVYKMESKLQDDDANGDSIFDF